MKQTKKNFFEALGFEDPEETKRVLMQLGVGIVFGVAILVLLGLGEWVGEWLRGC